MAEYKNDDTIAIFTSEPKGTVTGSGKVYFGEKYHSVIVVDDVTKTGKTITRLYVDIGAIFPNNKKTNEKAPDFTGKFELPKSEKVRISIWERNGQSGTFFSGNLQEEYKPEGGAQAKPTGGFGKPKQMDIEDPLDDNVPF